MHRVDAPESESESESTTLTFVGDITRLPPSFTAWTSLSLSLSVCGLGDFSGGFGFFVGRFEVLGSDFEGEEVTNRSRVACLDRRRGIWADFVGSSRELKKPNNFRPKQTRSLPKCRFRMSSSDLEEPFDEDPSNSRRPSFQIKREKSSNQSPQAILSSGDRSNVEHQKFLSLVIRKLRERVKPPSLFDQLSSDGQKRQLGGVEAVVESFRAVVRVTTTQPKDMRLNSPEDDDVIPSGFSTEDTQEMMEKLLDILVLARRQGRNIFPPRWAIRQDKLHASNNYR